MSAAQAPVEGTDATEPRRQIFAVGRGQYENIGDVLLRRPLLDWARENGRLHVYVGHSPAGYDDGLRLHPDDVVYRSFVSWYRALLAEAARGNADTLYKPGELQLTLIGMKEHLAMLPAVALVRARGGRVARIGAGARNFAPLPRALMWPSNALSSYTRWRDDRTADYLGFGPSMPDLGFSDGLDADALAAARAGDDTRDLFVVSLRDDTEVAPRPYPDAAWMRGVRGAADALGLRLVVVTQVSVDEERSQRLGRDLDAEVVSWPVLGAHDAHEARLRAVYRRTRVAASDRLHVIIAAFTEGAMPIGLQLDDADKISRHFDTIGLSGIALNTRDLDAEQLRDRLAELAGRRGEALGTLEGARARLAAVRSDLGRLLRRDEVVPVAAPASARPVVHHLGRAGDIPGGMTQVVNAYLSWPFDRVDNTVLVTRGDPGDHPTALFRFLAARRTLHRLGRSDRPAVVVAHLSERGSFVREGHLALLAARLGMPVVVHLHGSEFAAYEKTSPRRVARVLQAASHVIALSEESRAIAARHVGSSAVTVLPNAVPAGAPTRGAPAVVFGGVVSHRKGIDVLDRAWRRVHERFPEWELIVAGPIREGELVDAALPGATFLGSVPHDRLLDLLGEAAIAVLPSRDEAMPMFVLEALARSVCVISTEVGGIPAVLDDERGFLVPPGDVDALADALLRAMGDAAERERRARRGAEGFTAAFSAGAVYPRAEDIWLTPLGSRRLAEPPETPAPVLA
ncbi:glycosyltransferase [Microbacterium enclense]|uniref:glycosyltransferase n=1 Tax=Microbacterium enclense TaxID=993073 RepID=UPI0036DAF289